MWTGEKIWGLGNIDKQKSAKWVQAGKLAIESLIEGQRVLFWETDAFGLVMILIIKNKDFFKKNFTIVQKTPDDSNLKAPYWKKKAGGSHSLFTKV